MGVNVSMPLAADQGRPFDFATSWTFLAVMSTASAVERKRKDPRDGLGLTVAGDVIKRVRLGDISTRRPDHEAKFDYDCS